MACRVDEPTDVARAGELLALMLARVVVPLWLLVGALLKLADASPNHLPVAVVKWAGALGIDLWFVLRFSIGFELTVVGVMWLLPRIARPVGIAVLAAFLPVLIGDVAMGASSCGCFGSVQVHPGITLVMDVGFLLGLWLLGRRSEPLAASATLPTVAVVAAGLWTLASFAIAFAIDGSAAAAASSEAAPNSGTSAEAPLKAPAEGYYLPRYSDWIGRLWADVPLSQWIVGAPPGLDSGQRLLLFFRKDCEHCHALMEAYFVGPLAVPTTAIAVPERTGFPSVGVQPFPCDECDLAELPAGVDWFLQTPVLVRLEEGVVACAAEVTPEAPECLTF